MRRRPARGYIISALTHHPERARQFTVNPISLCVFSFAARPLLMALPGMDTRGFGRFIDTPRHELAAFFLRALRP